MIQIKRNVFISTANGTEFFAELSTKHQLFMGLSKSVTQKIFKSSIVQKYTAGQLLVQQGDNANYAYLIMEGCLRSLRTNNNGDEITICMLVKGDLCMESTLFMSGPSPVSVQVVNDAHIVSIPKTVIIKIVRQESQLAINLLTSIANYHKSSMYQIAAISIQSPLQRVGSYLLQQYAKQGLNTMEFDLSFKKSIIANYLGMAPETFSRCLGQLKQMGLEVNGDKIRLQKACALCRFCDANVMHECRLEIKKTCPYSSV